MSNFDLPIQNAPALPPAPAQPGAPLDAQESAARLQLKLGLRQIGIGLILMASASGLNFLLNRAGVMSPQISIWISLILRGIAIAFFIQGCLQITNAPERMDIKMFSLMVLGGVVPLPVMSALQSLLYRFGWFELGMVWIVIALVDAAAYGLMAFVFWRIDARLGDSNTAGTVATDDKPPPLALACFAFTGGVVLVDLLREFSLMPQMLYPFISVIVIGQYVALFVYGLMLRNRL